MERCYSFVWVWPKKNHYIYVDVNMYTLHVYVYSKHYCVIFFTDIGLHLSRFSKGIKPAHPFWKKNRVFEWAGSRQREALKRLIPSWCQSQTCSQTIRNLPQGDCSHRVRVPRIDSHPNQVEFLTEFRRVLLPAHCCAQNFCLSTHKNLKTNSNSHRSPFGQS